MAIDKNLQSIESASGYESVPIVGGMFSANREKSEAEKANLLSQLSKDELERLGLDAGVVGLETGPSAMRGAIADPIAVAAQRAALADLMNRSKGGLTLEDRAGLQQALDDVAMQERGNREAIMQQARARGGMSSGQTLNALLSGNQNAANAARNTALGIGGQASQRGLQALMAGSSLASNLRGQSFDEAAKRASAEDAINQFNANMRNQAFQNKYGLAMGKYGITQGQNAARLAAAGGQSQAAQNMGLGAMQAIGTLASAAGGGAGGAVGGVLGKVAK